MEIKVPNHIKILTHEYEVKFDQKQVVSAGTCGLTRHLYQEILLDATLPSSERNQVFLHEVLHTIERHMALKLDENDIDRLAEGLAQVLFESLGISLDWSDIAHSG